MSPKVTRDAGPLGSCLIQSALLPLATISAASAFPSGESDAADDRPRRLPARVHRRLQALPAHPHRLPRPGGGAGGVHQRPAVRELERVENPPISIPIPSSSDTGAPVIASLPGSKGKADQLSLAGHHQQVSGGRVAGVDPARQHVGLDGFSRLRERHGDDLEVADGLVGPPGAEQDTLGAGQHDRKLGADLMVGQHVVEQLEPPAAGGEPGDARVRLDVDVAVRRPVAPAGVDAVRERHRRAAAQRDGAELGPLDQESELAAVGREEGRPGARGPRHRRGLELIVLPEPELHPAGGADVDHALPVGRDGDPVARDVHRRQRLGRREIETEPVDARRGARAGASPTRRRAGRGRAPRRARPSPRSSPVRPRGRRRRRGCRRRDPGRPVPRPLSASANSAARGEAVRRQLLQRDEDGASTSGGMVCRCGRMGRAARSGPGPRSPARSSR